MIDLQALTAELAPIFAGDEERERRIYSRLQEAFRAAGLTEADLAERGGYAFHNPSLAKLESVFARYFRKEAALVRPQMVSGTHALSLALEAFCPPGTTLLTVPGRPYETLDAVIGWDGPAEGTLTAGGVRALWAPAGDALSVARREGAGVVLIQRSRGYARRQSMSVAAIGEIAAALSGRAIVIVDNCYGEFVEEEEPHGDVVVGSLIKNPGGALAPVGAYAAGRQDLLERLARRLFGPALGRAPGPVPEGLRPYVQGLSLAPHFVSQALQTTRLAAHIFHTLGYEVDPGPFDRRTDIVVRIALEGRDRLERAVGALQASFSVDGHLRPEGSPLPGYRQDVLMASPSFVPGGTLDLSADAPLKAPWDLFLQGGLSRPAASLAIVAMANAVGPRVQAPDLE